MISLREISGSSRLSRVVGDQLQSAGLRFVGIDHGLGDVFGLHQDGFDLAELDAIAADLDLGVDAAVEIELAVVPNAAIVAGAVDAA